MRTWVLIQGGLIENPEFSSVTLKRLSYFPGSRNNVCATVGIIQWVKLRYSVLEIVDKLNFKLVYLKIFYSHMRFYEKSENIYIFRGEYLKGVLHELPKSKIQDIIIVYII